MRGSGKRTKKKIIIKLKMTKTGREKNMKGNRRRKKERRLKKTEMRRRGRKRDGEAREVKSLRKICGKRPSFLVRRRIENGKILISLFFIFFVSSLSFSDSLALSLFLYYLLFLFPFFPLFLLFRFLFLSFFSFPFLLFSSFYS